MQTFGRAQIITDYEVVDEKNILDILQKAQSVHNKNQNEIKYLYDYYKGKQPILGREKIIRPEINNRIVVNRAAEIVDFKTSYLLGEPMQYVSRGSGDELMNKINKLNDYMFAEDKPSIDMELAMCFTICGTAFRMVLPDPIGQTDDAPFELYVLDPQNTFVVYNNRIGKVPVVAFKCVVKEDNTEIYSAYTESYYYEIEGGSVTKIIPHSLGYIPIIEYPLNESRIGAFEPVISMLDAINNIQSNRLDAVEQFVQALMVFENCDINDTEFILLREEGALKIKSTETSPAKVYYLNDQLDQSQTQTLIDDLYQAVLTVVGMPSQSGESNSTSDTGSAVIMRSGWHTAESRAKQTELIFKKSEKKFLKIIFRICRDIGGLDLKLSEIEQKFTRRNYADILTKSQVLTTMLSNPAIHPALAFSHSGMFTDSEAAFAMSQKWKDEQIIKSEPQQSDDPIKKEVVLD